MTTMRWSPWRPLVAVAAVGAVVFGASQVTRDVQVGPQLGPDQLAAVGSTSSTLATLVCPGQLRMGAEGVADVPGSAPVVAAMAPTSVLPPNLPLGSSRALTLLPWRGAGSARATKPEQPLTASVPASRPVILQASGAASPGVLAAESWLRASGDDRGYAVTQCQQPSASTWLLAGGGGPGRVERLLLTNPGGNSVDVEVAIFGTGKNRYTVPITVAGGAREQLMVDRIAGSEPAMAFRVTAKGGTVQATLVDTWREGAVSWGIATANPSTPPSQDFTIPGVSQSGGATLRLLGTGDTETIATVSILGANGVSAPAGLRAITLEPGKVTDVSLTAAVPNGNYAVRVTADNPVVGAVFSQRRDVAGDRQADFGWIGSTPAIRTLAGAIIPADVPSAKASVIITSGPAPARGTLTVVGTSTLVQPISLPANTTATVAVPLGARVYLSSTAGELRAGVTVVANAQGPLYAVFPLIETPVYATVVPPRRIN